MNRKMLEDFLYEKENLKDRRLFVWGTGNTASLYQEGLQRLEKEGIEIYGYADNNAEKWGKRVFGKKVYSPIELEKEENVLVLIASPQPEIVRAVGKQLDGVGIEWRHIDDYIFKGHREEVLQAYDFLEDEESRVLYAELIQSRIRGEYPNKEYVTDNQYFGPPEFARYNPSETFVDCGAYVGDSIEKYIWSRDGVCGRIVAFEPDAKNRISMKHRLERLKKEWGIGNKQIEVVPYGVAEQQGEYFVERYEDNNGLGTKVVIDSNPKDADVCKVTSLDEYFDEGTQRIDIIKADIEGFEYKLLLGAEKTIKKFRPKLAICIYHNAVDFYQIILMIKTYNPDYKLVLRHHSYALSDTVVYAY